jgi:general secretion pathway protein F
MAGDVLRGYWIVLLLLGVLATAALRRFFRREDVAAQLDRRLLSLPRIGTLIGKLETAKFCRTLGLLQANGVPLATGLPIASESFANRMFRQAGTRAAVRVREGERLSTVLQKERLFPPLALQMMRISEETGRLDGMLVKIADMYDQDVRISVDKLMTLLAPALTVTLGVIIAAIIGAVLSAILSVNDLVI